MLEIPALDEWRDMSIKKKFTVAIAAVAIGIGSMLAVPQAASASDPVDMNLACQMYYGNTSYAAKLVNANSAYGWKCWNRQYPEQFYLGPFFDVDVKYYCMVAFGRYAYNDAAYFTNVNSAYSWRCR